MERVRRRGGEWWKEKGCRGSRERRGKGWKGQRARIRKEKGCRGEQEG
jgi:hypothetical protein